jgi:hypothetical protein
MSHRHAIDTLRLLASVLRLRFPSFCCCTRKQHTKYSMRSMRSMRCMRFMRYMRSMHSIRGGFVFRNWGPSRNVHHGQCLTSMTKHDSGGSPPGANVCVVLIFCHKVDCIKNVSILLVCSRIFSLYETLPLVSRHTCLSCCFVRAFSICFVLSPRLFSELFGSLFQHSDVYYVRTYFCMSVFVHMYLCI